MGVEVSPSIARSSLDLWAPTVGKASNFEVGLGSNAGAALTSGTLHLSAGLVIPAGMSVSTITFYTGTTAVGTPTNHWACLARLSDRVLVAVSADKADEAWAANTAKTFDFTAAYQPSQDTALWVGLMVAAGTPPTIFARDYNSVNASLPSRALFPYRGGTSNTGQTTPLAVSTVASAVTSNRLQLWAYVA